MLSELEGGGCALWGRGTLQCARTNLSPDFALSIIFFFIVTNYAKLVYNVGTRYAAKFFFSPF